MLWKLLCWLLVGALAGWLAGKIMHLPDGTTGQNIVLGLVGSLVGGIVAWILGLAAKGFIGSVIIAAAGACLVIWLSRRSKR